MWTIRLLGWQLLQDFQNIMHETSPHLDGQYAAFGKVTDGLDVVNKIAEVPTDYSDRPLEPQMIQNMTVDTFGVEYPEPETV